MSEREMNKKGQEMSLTTILLIVLGLVVVVVIILAVSGFFGPIFAGLKLAPSGLATLVKACNGYVQIDSKTDYCTFRSTTIDSKTEYLSCLDSRVQKDLEPNAQNWNTCDNYPRAQECQSLVISGVSKPVVGGSSGGVACTSAESCVPDVGSLKQAGAACPTSPETTKEVTLNDGSICCVKKGATASKA